MQRGNMTQKIFECLTMNDYIKATFPTHRHPNGYNLSRIRVCTNTQRRKNRLYVYEEGLQKWTHGFYSYDKRGIIFYSSFTGKYEFSGIVSNVYHVDRCNKATGRNPVDKGMRWDRRLHKGIATENMIVEDLEQANILNLKIHHLENSGQFSGGSDIVISLNPVGAEELPYDTVLRGICAIEVLGTTKRYKTDDSLSFTYHKYVDFKRWQDELVDNDVLPVIAWNYEGTSWYVILTDSALYDGFYIHRGSEYHQQTNYALVRKIEDYKLNAIQLFYCLGCHLKTVDIIHKIEKNRPLSVGSNALLVSCGYPLKQGCEYDNVVDKIRKYCFETSKDGDSL